MKNFFAAITLCFALFGAFLFLGAPGLAQNPLSVQNPDLMNQKPEGYPTAVLAGGCFWCTESEYRGVDGVFYTRVGYTGGHIDNPKYDDTHDSKSGHAEVVEVTYDPEKVTYRNLIEFFLVQVHDPTQLNRQGGDVGTQYRSAIFYANEDEKKIAEEVIAEVDASGRYDDKIVTTLESAATFWEAEGYHQQYYEKYEKKNGKPHILQILKKSKDELNKL